MEENFKNLKKDILEATKDIEELNDILSSIKGSTIFIGSGGSKVVATYAAKILAKKNNIMGTILDPSDIKGFNIDIVDNIFIASYGGKNHGVKSSIIDGKKVYLLSARKTKIKDEILISYSLPWINSFISLNQTIVPMAVLLKYYLGSDFDYLIEVLFTSLDKFETLELEELTNIFTNYDTLTASTFIESTLCESGLSIPIVHEKYDYCHGRSTINKNHLSSSIILINNESDLDRVLESVLESTKTKLLKLKGMFEDPLVNDFFLTLQSMYLLKNVATSRKVNLSKIDYDRDVVKKLYYFKGSM